MTTQPLGVCMQVLTTARPHSLQVRDRSRPLPPKVSDAERQVMAALNACSTRLHRFAKEILAARVDGTIAFLSAAVSAAAADIPIDSAKNVPSAQ